MSLMLGMKLLAFLYIMLHTILPTLMLWHDTMRTKAVHMGADSQQLASSCSHQQPAPSIMTLFQAHTAA